MAATWSAQRPHSARSPDRTVAAAACSCSSAVSLRRSAHTLPIARSHLRLLRHSTLPARKLPQRTLLSCLCSRVVTVTLRPWSVQAASTQACVSFSATLRLTGCSAVLSASAVLCQSDPRSIPASATALLVCDMQNMMVDLLKSLNADATAALVARVASVIAACRAASVPVIYAIAAFRPGTPEIAALNLAFSAYKGKGLMLEGSKEAEIHSAVRAEASDVVVVKRRVSAFSGSDLDVVLSSLGTRHLIVLGISTSGIVLSTVRYAADRDFVLTVVSDACADRDEEVHRVLMDKVLVKQAKIETTEQIVQRLQTKA